MNKGYLDRIDLHEYLRHRAYDHALITTYTFDPAFFEEYCLEKCTSLQTNGNITVLVDRNTYEQLIQNAAAGGSRRLTCVTCCTQSTLLAPSTPKSFSLPGATVACS